MRHLVVPLGGEVITKVVHMDTGVPELLGYLRRRPGDVEAKAALQSPGKLSRADSLGRSAGQHAEPGAGQGLGARHKPSGLPMGGRLGIRRGVELGPAALAATNQLS